MHSMMDRMTIDSSADAKQRNECEHPGHRKLKRLAHRPIIRDGRQRGQGMLGRLVSRRPDANLARLAAWRASEWFWFCGVGFHLSDLAAKLPVDSLHLCHLGLLLPQFVSRLSQPLFENLAQFTLGSEPLFEIGDLAAQFYFVGHSLSSSGLSPTPAACGKT
jgi:hypothetical protein